MNVLVVDMIEGFTRLGALASPRVEALIAKQVEFLKQIPDDSFVVFACDSHGPDDSEFKRMPKHCEAGTPEAEICPELLAVVKDRNIQYVIVPKTTHSAFFQTNMDDLIEGEGDEWVLIGCVTDICITANVMEMDYRGKSVTVVRDLVDTYEITPEDAEIMRNPAATHDPEIYNSLFLNYYLPGVWGATIQTAEEVLKEFQRG